MTSLVNADISRKNTPQNDNFLTTVTTAYSKPSSSTASSKSNTNDTSKSEETFLKIVDYATFINDSYDNKPVIHGSGIKCKFTEEHADEEYTHECKGWELLLHEGYTETPDSTGLISSSISALKVWKAGTKLCLAIKGSKTAMEWISNANIGENDKILPKLQDNELFRGFNI